MTDDTQAEASTAEKLDATDGDVGNRTFYTLRDFFLAIERGEIGYDDPEFRALDEAAIDDERFEWGNAANTKDVYREVALLELDVLRGVRSVRNCVIDSDTQNGIAQMAYARTGNRARLAYKLGREWALSNRATYAELALRDRRHERDRERRDAREAKSNWERGEGYKNFERFCDESA